MNMRQVVSALRGQGYKITTYERKEGGIRITSINGTTFTGSTGNAFARSLTGTHLSTAQARQLFSEELKTKKGQFGHKKKDDLTAAEKKEIRRIQKLFRQRGTKEGKPTRKNYRFNKKQYGEIEAKRRLHEAARYAQGIAYTENVRALVLRIRQDANKFDDEGARGYLDGAAEGIERKIDAFRDEWIAPCYSELYAMEQHQQSPEDTALHIAVIIAG